MAKRPPKTFESVVELVEGFLCEFQAETDRGTTVVIGAYLDDLLAGMLKKHFVNNPKVAGSLLDFQGPLGTFSSRINLVYCLGLIREDQFADLDAIRKIRNEFAHSHQPLSFDQPPVADLSANLNQLTNMDSLRDEMSNSERDLLLDRFRTPREKFVGNAIHLAVGLMVRGANIVHQTVGKVVASEARKLPFEVA